MPVVNWSCQSCEYETKTSFEPDASEYPGLFYWYIPDRAYPDPCPTCGYYLVTAWICGDCGAGEKAASRPEQCRECGLSGTMRVLRSDNPAAGCAQMTVGCADEVVLISLIAALGLLALAKLGGFTMRCLT